MLNPAVCIYPTEAITMCERFCQFILFYFFIVITPQLLKEMFDVVGPTLLNLINKCLESGVVPDYLKHASV